MDADLDIGMHRITPSDFWPEALWPSATTFSNLIERLEHLELEFQHCSSPDLDPLLSETEELIELLDGFELFDLINEVLPIQGWNNGVFLGTHVCQDVHLLATALLSKMGRAHGLKDHPAETIDGEFSRGYVLKLRKRIHAAVDTKIADLNTVASGELIVLDRLLGGSGCFQSHLQIAIGQLAALISPFSRRRGCIGSNQSVGCDWLIPHEDFPYVEPLKYRPEVYLNDPFEIAQEIEESTQTPFVESRNPLWFHDKYLEFMEVSSSLSFVEFCSLDYSPIKASPGAALLNQNTLLPRPDDESPRITKGTEWEPWENAIEAFVGPDDFRKAPGTIWEKYPQLKIDAGVRSLSEFVRIRKKLQSRKRDQKK